MIIRRLLFVLRAAIFAISSMAPISCEAGSDTVFSGNWALRDFTQSPRYDRRSGALGPVLYSAMLLDKDLLKNGLIQLTCYGSGSYLNIDVDGVVNPAKSTHADIDFVFELGGLRRLRLPKGKPLVENNMVRWKLSPALLDLMRSAEGFQVKIVFGAGAYVANYRPEGTATAVDDFREHCLAATSHAI